MNLLVLPSDCDVRNTVKRIRAGEIKPHRIAARVLADQRRLMEACSFAIPTVVEGVIPDTELDKLLRHRRKAIPFNGGMLCS